MPYVSLHGRAFGFDSETGAIIRNGTEGGSGETAVATVTSTATALTPRGMTSLTTTAAKDYTLSAPIAGVRKTITTSVTTSTAVRTVTLASGTYLTTAGTAKTIATFNDINQVLSLQGVSTAAYLVTGTIGVTLST